MITFVNAKLNLGLNVVERRPDGYHNLETVFYPVGLYNGTPDNPTPFCDILECNLLPETAVKNCLTLTGRQIDCPTEKNLVWRAAERITALTGRHFRVTLDKHLPDGAGLGGGSADATFTLKTLAKLAAEAGAPAIGEDILLEEAARLGADCPFFLKNEPSLGKGIGERLSPLPDRLKGMWALIVKPDVYVSTGEAFAGITPCRPEMSAEDVYAMPIDRWRDNMTNDFEAGIFAMHPQLSELKERLYDAGALYAQMSGSGSSLFGIFRTVGQIKAIRAGFDADANSYICLL